ncbi:MAG: MBL fold metallo-hydrolase [Lachnospiraceae bacterium]|nr:MBL fold metallo-hydrolase [Lachnospiraceae bacterium]
MRINGELRISTLIENMPDEKGKLLAEHGLSLHIEFDGRQILFDTGQTGDFIKNAADLGINLKDLDDIMISHGHYDHSGGVMTVLSEIEHPIPFYVGEGFFTSKYKHLSDGTYRYNGNPFTEEDLKAQKIDLHIVTEDVTNLSEKILIFKNFPAVSGFEKMNEKFVLPQGENCIRDEFREEIALGLRTSKGLVLIVGCSHVGICNILQAVSERVDDHIYAVLGGTHLMEADEERLRETMEVFREFGIQCVAVSHCTGEQGIALARETFKEQFILNNTGNRFEL